MNDKRKQATFLAVALAVGVVATGVATSLARRADARQDAAKPPTTAAKAPDVAEMDKPIRDFSFRNILAEGEKDRTVKLSDYKGKKAVVAMFMANRCGTTWTYEKKIGDLLKDYKAKDVAFVAVHSNYSESDAEIKGQLEQRNIDVPLLDDKKDQAFANYIGATNTPTFVVIDKGGVLRYKGSFDMRRDESKTYVRTALDAALANKPVEVKATRAFG